MTSTEVATSNAGNLLSKYEGAFTSSLPSHIEGGQWMAVAHGVLRSNADLRAAADNDPGAFLGAMLQAARLGLEPGTEQFYLVPFKQRGVAKVQGITGYQGLIELIYRAGAVSSVIVEVVHAADRFEYAPGRDERPRHEIDWDADDRGPLRLAYAYAVMKDGATSKVVVLNRSDINRIKKSSQGAGSQYSPWQTNESAMWLKSAARQLAKWVPTSAEYRRQQLRDAQAVARESHNETMQIDIPMPQQGENVDPLTGEVLDADLVDDSADSNDWPEVKKAGDQA